MLFLQIGWGVQQGTTIPIASFSEESSCPDLPAQWTLGQLLQWWNVKFPCAMWPVFCAPVFLQRENGICQGWNILCFPQVAAIFGERVMNLMSALDAFILAPFVLHLPEMPLNIFSSFQVVAVSTWGLFKLGL